MNEMTMKGNKGHMYSTEICQITQASFIYIKKESNFIYYTSKLVL